MPIPTWAATAAGASHDHAPSAPSTPPPATADDTKNTPSSTQPHTQSSGHLISPDNTTADNTTADNTTADNTTADNTTADNTTADNTTADNTALDESAPNEPAPDSGDLAATTVSPTDQTAIDDPSVDTVVATLPPALAVQRQEAAVLPHFVRFAQQRPDTTITIRSGRFEPVRPQLDDVNTASFRFGRGLGGVIRHLLHSRRPWGTDPKFAPPLPTDRDNLAFPVLGPMWFGNSWGDCRGSACERQHVGTDIIGVRMQPIRAAVDGTIDSARPADATGIAGARVTIVADDGYRYHYFHLNNDTPGTDDGEAEHHWTLPPALTTGQRVSAGQIIGYLGDSGNSEHSVAHLHFEIRDPAGTPVPSYPLLVEAAARETCSVGLGPWVVPLTSSAATTPVSTRSENLAENSPPIAQPKRVEHATIRAGSLSGEWSIDSEGRVTAWGAAALVAPTTSCQPHSAIYRSDASLPAAELSARLDDGATRLEEPPSNTGIS